MVIGLHFPVYHQCRAKYKAVHDPALKGIQLAELRMNQNMEIPVCIDNQGIITVTVQIGGFAEFFLVAPDDSLFPAHDPVPVDGQDGTHPDGQTIPPCFRPSG